MLSADIFILYVNNPIHSAKFYADILSIQPVETSPTFALFVLDNGFKLGLWSKFTVDPLPSAQSSSCGGEIILTIKNRAEVDALYTTWGIDYELTIIQKPTVLDFGYAFTAADPDGHRLRVCCFQ